MASHHGSDLGHQVAAAAGVAEAVARAVVSAAAEAAEAVHVTAKAVTEAAARAAVAAEKARGARAFAAEAAAQSVAHEAQRTAARVQQTADRAAAEVQQTASLAAEELVRSLTAGTAPDLGRLVLLLQETIRAAAEATARSTIRAADQVRNDDSAAAAQVAQTVAAVELVVEREVTAAAVAQRELATAAAVAVALETEARATGVEVAAREAATALLTHARLASTEVESADGAPVRATEMERILAAADDRDARAEKRDRVADARERAASLRSFLGEQQEGGEQYVAALPGRRAAALDRGEAMNDRASAAADRAELSVGLLPGTAVGGPDRSGGARVEVLQLALRESQDRLRFLVDAVSEYAIITLSPAGIIESWNTGAERLKGYSTVEALGSHFSMFYTAEDRDAGLPQSLLDRARAAGSHEETGWRVRRDGSQFWADIIISAAHDDSGNLTGFVKVTRDLTEQHRLEAAQDSFYNAFEHDFRVPVAAIKGFTELIKDADLEDHQSLAERVDANADRLLTMVVELVDYARLRSGLIPISVQIVDLRALTQLAVDNLASMSGSSRIRVAAVAPVKVLADPVALERAVANLLTNALKYSPDESGINVVCGQIDDAGVLTIADQGRGIDERDLSSIFLEFERGRLAQEDAGTGLGLASVQRLIGLQGGTVAITSQLEVGTTVTIRLPLAP